MSSKVLNIFNQVVFQEKCQLLMRLLFSYSIILLVLTIIVLANYIVIV